MMAKFIICLSLNKLMRFLKFLRHDIHILTFFISKFDFLCYTHVRQVVFKQILWIKKCRMKWTTGQTNICWDDLKKTVKCYQNINYSMINNYCRPEIDTILSFE